MDRANRRGVVQDKAVSPFPVSNKWILRTDDLVFCILNFFVIIMDVNL